MSDTEQTHCAYCGNLLTIAPLAPNVLPKMHQTCYDRTQNSPLGDGTWK
jgi:hypothetical protein